MLLGLLGAAPAVFSQSTVHFPDRSYSTLSYGGSLWIGTPRGLYRYRSEDNVWSAYGPQNGLLSAAITSLDVRNDVLWIGQDRGITSFDLRSNTMLHYDSTNGLSSGAVRTTAFEEDYVWTGGSGGGSRYDNLIEEWQSISSEQGLTGSTIHAIVPKAERVFLATERGVNEYDPQHERWRMFTPQAAVPELPVPQSGSQQGDATMGNAVSADAPIINAFVAGSWLWLLRDGELLRFDMDARVFSPYPLREFRGSDIREIIVSGGSFWMVTADNLWQYDATADALRPFLEIDQLPDRDLRAVALSSDGNTIWFSTASGLTRFDRSTGSWTYLTAAAGLPDIDIQTLFTLGDGVITFSDEALVYYKASEDRWYSFPLLASEGNSETTFSLDPAKGSFVDFGSGYRLDLSGSRSAWLWQDPFRRGELVYGTDEPSSRNDLKARLDLGNGRRISAQYNDSDFEYITYGAEYRGARDDVLQSLQWGDMRAEQGNRLLQQSFGMFGVGGRAVYGGRTERYGRSLFEATAVSGQKTTATATESFTGRTRTQEYVIPDAAWQRTAWYHLRSDRQFLPLGTADVRIYREPYDFQIGNIRNLTDETIAGIRGEWVQMIEGVDYFVDFERGLLRLAEPDMRPNLVARIERDGITEDLLLGNNREQYYEIQNRYFVGGTGIIPSSFRLRITDAAGMELPLNSFGVDRNGDGLVDAEFMDYNAGILHFPEAQPFPAGAYEANPSTTDRMLVHCDAYSTGYKLGQYRIIRGSESVLVDGAKMSAGEDYILDYSSGFLLFTRDGAVQDDSRIEVEYEYVRLASDERFTRVGLTVSPSDFTQASVAGGQFQTIGGKETVRFAQAQTELRWQSDAVDFRIAPEYQISWSDTTNGQAAGISASLSTPQARLSLRSTLRERAYAEPQRRDFAHGRLLDEHRVEGEYDIVPELRAFAQWTKRSGYDTLSGSATDDMYAGGGLQWLPPGLPSITLRGDRSEETLDDRTRDRSGGRLDLVWVPDANVLNTTGFNSARLSGYARLAEEQILGGSDPGRFRMGNFFLRSVLAPRPMFTINAYYQADLLDRENPSGVFADDRREDKLYLDLIMEQLRGISLGARVTRNLQQFATEPQLFNQYLRGSMQGSLRLSPGTWVDDLSSFTLYFTASRNTTHYNSEIAQASILDGLFGSAAGKIETETVADQYESRLEWRPAPELLYSVSGRYIENTAATWKSSSTTIRRELTQRIDLRPDSRTLYALQFLIGSSRSNSFSYSQQTYSPSIWAESRISRALLVRLSVNATYSQSEKYMGTSDALVLTPTTNVTLSLNDLPVIRRLELRDDLSFTYQEGSSSWQSTPSFYGRYLRNSLFMDWYPHPVLMIRFRYTTISEFSSRLLMFNTDPDAELQLIMQL